MCSQDLFANAKESIFGQPPSNGLEMIGYNISLKYFEPLIKEAESILIGIEVPRKSFNIYLSNAFNFSSYDGFRKFPLETQKIIALCTKRFRLRYESLFDQLELKAA